MTTVSMSTHEKQSPEARAGFWLRLVMIWHLVLSAGSLGGMVGVWVLGGATAVWLKIGLTVVLGVRPLSPYSPPATSAAASTGGAYCPWP